MIQSEKIKICTFLHFSVSESLPYYTEIYINELSNYFDKVFVLLNKPYLQKPESFSLKNIEFVCLENKGYDFGMFYTFISTQNLDDFSQIAIVNDSNILINKLGSFFQKTKNSGADFWGLIDSSEKPWFSSHIENYHLQSHFIVLNENAIKLLPSYFQQIDIVSIMNETETVKVRRMVINSWEIGLSQYFLKHGLKSMSIYNSHELRLKYSSKKHNVANSLYYELASEEYPLLKRKVLFNKAKWYRRKSPSWQQTIRDFTNLDYNSEKLIDELNDWHKLQSA